MALVKLDGYLCERCSHTWIPRDREGIGLPTVCPKCKSPYWNTPRRQKALKNPEKAIPAPTKRKKGVTSRARPSAD